MFNSQITAQLYTIVYATLIPVFGLLFLLWLIKINHLFNRHQSRIFTMAVLVNLFLIIVASIDYVLSTISGTNTWIFRTITTATHFAVAPLLPIMLMHLYMRKKLSFLVYVPFLINVVICLSSPFTQAVFSVSTDNKYGRGPLFFLPLAITITYILFLLINPLLVQRQGRMRELAFLTAIIGVVIVAICLEVGLHFQCLEYGCSAIALIMYYVLQNIHYFASDPLTGAYNRQMYNHMLANISNTSSCIFVLVDLNDFKEINDTQGHEAGDKALILFVSILYKHLANIGVTYRIGGDEFMLVSNKSNRQEFVSAIEKGRIEASANHLSFAYGIGEYHAGDEVDEVLREVDRKMYAQKSIMKQKNSL